MSPTAAPVSVASDNLHGMTESTTPASTTGHPDYPDHPGQPQPLTDLERDILDFERAWWKYAGAKEGTIRDRWDMSATRYYQLLNALIDRPEALEHDPMLVRRLQRVRTARQRQRSARRIERDA